MEEKVVGEWTERSSEGNKYAKAGAGVGTTTIWTPKGAGYKSATTGIQSTKYQKKGQQEFLQNLNRRDSAGQPDRSVEWQAEPRDDKARRGICNAKSASSRPWDIQQLARIRRLGEGIFFPFPPKEDETAPLPSDQQGHITVREGTEPPKGAGNGGS